MTIKQTTIMIIFLHLSQTFCGYTDQNAPTDLDKIAAALGISLQGIVTLPIPTIAAARKHRCIPTFNATQETVIHLKSDWDHVSAMQGDSFAWTTDGRVNAHLRDNVVTLYIRTTAHQKPTDQGTPMMIFQPVVRFKTTLAVDQLRGIFNAAGTMLILYDHTDYELWNLLGFTATGLTSDQFVLERILLYQFGRGESISPENIGAFFFHFTTPDKIQQTFNTLPKMYRDYFSYLETVRCRPTCVIF